MKPNKEARKLMFYHKRRMTLSRVMLLELLRRRDLYLRQIANTLDINFGSLHKMIEGLIERGLAVKVEEVSPNDHGIGANYSALVCLTDEGRELLKEADSQ